MIMLSQIEINVFESPDPERIYAYSPGITRLPSGRLIATMDLGGPGACDLQGEKWVKTEPDWDVQGRIYTSDDGGEHLDSTRGISLHARTSFHRW